MFWLARVGLGADATATTFSITFEALSSFPTQFIIASTVKGCGGRTVWSVTKVITADCNLTVVELIERWPIGHQDLRAGEGARLSRGARPAARQERTAPINGVPAQ